MTSPSNETKKIKVCVLVHTLTEVNHFIYKNHIEFFVWHAKNRRDIEFHFMPPNRCAIDTARNLAARYAMEQECDYLMFIDDDVMLPKDSLHRLLAHDKDICQGLVVIRGYPFNAMAFKYKGHSGNKRRLEFYNDFPTNKNPVRVDAVGFSCCLIKVDLLKKLSAPLFLTGPHNTEDVYFCVKAKDETQGKATIYMDHTIQCGHLMGREAVEWSRRKKFQEFYKEVAESETGRGRNYIKAQVKNVRKKAAHV